MKKFLTLFSFIAIAWLCNVAYAEAYKTLTFPDDNQANNKKSSYTETWTAKIGTDEWSIANFNNNKWDWSSIKCGRKSNASIASIATGFAVDKAISDVVITIPAIHFNVILLPLPDAPRIANISFSITKSTFK